MGLGREGYIDRLLNRGPKGQFYDDNDRNFYLAYTGDKTAFKRFLASKDRNIAGEPSEGWISDVVVLILSYNDSALHDFLVGIDPKTRNYVCYIMVIQLLPEDLKQYPKTQALYDPKPFQRTSRHGMVKW